MEDGSLKLFGKAPIFPERLEDAKQRYIVRLGSATPFTISGVLPFLFTIASVQIAVFNRLRNHAVVVVVVVVVVGVVVVVVVVNVVFVAFVVVVEVIEVVVLQ
eukprot:5530381-Amphidinium_carterae.1